MPPLQMHVQVVFTAKALGPTAFRKLAARMWAKQSLSAVSGIYMPIKVIFPRESQCTMFAAGYYTEICREMPLPVSPNRPLEYHPKDMTGLTLSRSSF
jgi:hypothetical protein